MGQWVKLTVCRVNISMLSSMVHTGWQITLGLALSPLPQDSIALLHGKLVSKARVCTRHYTKRHVPVVQHIHYLVQGRGYRICERGGGGGGGG